MSLLKDAISSMKEVILLSDKVGRVGKELTEVSTELRNHGDRLIRLETLVEVAKFRNNINNIEDKT
ncbi:hypothetical protein MNBD_GAMMA01-343 [hydrothermal vent metagenome]|uniref:Uncharacterized protein n=1 Tax=hydrothermal vent metagenome TaxID=652676 RepID=A0A3B0VI48_9ZZZZ